MRIVVLSDTHVPTRATGIPGIVIEECQKSDLVIHAGDFTSESVLEELEAAAPVKGVLGNMDSPDLGFRLPSRLDLELEGFRVCVAHGWGPHTNIESRVLALFDGEPDILIHGHSHDWTEKRSGGRLTLNPGAVCGPRERSFAILELERGAPPRVHRILIPWKA